MKNITTIVLCLAFTSLWITACEGSQTSNPEQIVSTQTAYQVWSGHDKSSFIFLDVRTPSEYQDGHIPGAINMPIQTISEHLQDIPKGKALYVYCESGVRASKVATLLNTAGFKHVYNFEASMRGWRKAGYPIEK